MCNCHSLDVGIDHVFMWCFSLFDLMKAEEDIEAQLRNDFILDQLLILAGSLDLADEFGR